MWRLQTKGTIDFALHTLSSFTSILNVFDYFIVKKMCFGYSKPMQALEHEEPIVEEVVKNIKKHN